MRENRDKVFLKTEAKRIITRLFKHSLSALEDVRFQHQAALGRLKDQLSPEQIEILNYLDFHRYSMLRKRALDNGNETIRDFDNFLENFDIELKNNISEIEDPSSKIEGKNKKEKGD